MKHAKDQSIILDFDGTIADSFAVFLEALQATIHNVSQPTAEEIEDLRRSSAKEVMKKLGIKSWQLPMLLMRGRREIKARYADVQAFAGMAEALKNLQQRYTLFIVSTNGSETIENFLEQHKLRDYITRVYGNIGLLNKAKALKKVCGKESLDISRCLYVGDEIRDIEAAKSIGMTCVAVGWGYNAPDILQSHKPNALARTPQELIEIIYKRL